MNIVFNSSFANETLNHISRLIGLIFEYSIERIHTFFVRKQRQSRISIDHRNWGAKSHLHQRLYNYASTWGTQLRKNIANPTAMLLASANMLDHMAMGHHGSKIRNAVLKTIKVNKMTHLFTNDFYTCLQFIA